MSIAETALASGFHRLVLSLRKQRSACPKTATPSAVRVGQRWKVRSPQGEWLDATVLQFDEGLVVLRFDQPERAGSREGVTLPHFMLTTPDCYRCEAA